YERLCRSLHKYAKKTEQLKLLWKVILEKSRGRPDCINSSHVEKIWKELCADKRYRNICQCEDDIMYTIEMTLNQYSKNRKYKQLHENNINNTKDNNSTCGEDITPHHYNNTINDINNDMNDNNDTNNNNTNNNSNTNNNTNNTNNNYSNYDPSQKNYYSSPVINSTNTNNNTIYNNNNNICNNNNKNNNNNNTICNNSCNNTICNSSCSNNIICTNSNNIYNNNNQGTEILYSTPTSVQTSSSINYLPLSPPMSDISTISVEDTIQTTSVINPTITNSTVSTYPTRMVDTMNIIPSSVPFQYSTTITEQPVIYSYVQILNPNNNNPNYTFL
ncbi:hypothetical protein PIROE2DRAFT_16650, partial [Piromyces sp. E2]